MLRPGAHRVAERALPLLGCPIPRRIEREATGSKVLEFLAGELSHPGACRAPAGSGDAEAIIIVLFRRVAVDEELHLLIPHEASEAIQPTEDSLWAST
jgi:hypothetical protein